MVQRRLHPSIRYSKEQEVKYTGPDRTVFFSSPIWFIVHNQRGNIISNYHQQKLVYSAIDNEAALTTMHILNRMNQDLFYQMYKMPTMGDLFQSVACCERRDFSFAKGNPATFVKEIFNKRLQVICHSKDYMHQWRLLRPHEQVEHSDPQPIHFSDEVCDPRTFSGSKLACGESYLKQYYRNITSNPLLVTCPDCIAQSEILQYTQSHRDEITEEIFHQWQQ